MHKADNPPKELDTNQVSQKDASSTNPTTP